MATDDEHPTRDHGHPVPAGVRELAGAVTILAERPLFTLDATATRETLLELDRV